VSNVSQTAPVTEWRPHPAGAEGAKVSLEKCSERIRKDYIDPLVVAFSRRVLQDSPQATSTKGKAEALLNAMKARARYILDPVNSEYIASARLILCLDSTQKDYCHAGGDCFPEGTLLLRDDYELVPIEQIKVGDRIWGRDKWSRVEGKKFKGQLAVDAIEMNNGSTMFLTGDHKVYVGQCVHGRTACGTCQSAAKHGESFDRVKVSDLVEDAVLLRPERIDFGAGEMEPGRAYVEGLALADGWVDGDSRFKIAGKDGHRKEAQKHEVKEICDRLGVETTWHERYITVKDPDWAQRIATLGSHARFKHAETLNLQRQAAEMLLRGLMADSTANTGAASRTFSTTSRLMAVQVRVLHRMFGQSMGWKMLTPEQHGGEGQHPLWRLGQRDTGKERSSWALTIRSIERAVLETPCWDIQTEDHYVYLPEHDVTVSNCDELTCTMCSMLMAVGIDCKLVGQGFSSSSKVPTHVLLAAFDPQSETWFKIDPSTSLPVGRSYPATSEVEVDPLTGAVPDFSGPGPAASFVGVGGVQLIPVRDSNGALGYVPSSVLGRLAAAIPASSFAQASSDLGTMIATIQAGDLAVQSGQYAYAIQVYKAAGNVGATIVGPDIDLAGAPNTTQPITQQAWVLNGQLAALPTTNTAAAAAAASAAVRQMVAYYQQAIVAAETQGNAPSPGPTTGSNAVIAWTVGLGIAAGLGWAVWRSRRHAAQVQEAPRVRALPDKLPETESLDTRRTR
jgi:hypothetical protein